VTDVPQYTKHIYAHMVWISQRTFNML